LEEQVSQPAFKVAEGEAALRAPVAAGSPNVVLAYAAKPGAEPITGEVVRGICELRRARQDAFPGRLFSDPTWDILLNLYAAHVDSQRLSITRLTRMCGVPPTTVLRRLALLQDKRLVTRTADPFDARRVYVALSESGAEAMDRCFAVSGLGSAFL
jgi:DNA-binding MarR family transcriptional regulator